MLAHNRRPSLSVRLSLTIAGAALLAAGITCALFYGATAGLRATDGAISPIRWDIVAIGLAVIVPLSIALSFHIGRSLSRPISAMAQTLRRMVDDDTEVTIPARDRMDEVGEMAAALAALRHRLVRARWLEQCQRQAEDDVPANGEHVDEENLSGAVRTTTHMMENMRRAVAATERLSAAELDVSQQIGNATDRLRVVVGKAEQSGDTMLRLGAATRRIAEAADLIRDGAEQSSLLALNATIEAVRAGEAGRDFVAIATEVRALADRTVRATDRIAAHVDDIRQIGGGSIDAMVAMARAVGQLDKALARLAAATKAQSAATGEISRNVAEASSGTAGIAGLIREVADMSVRPGEAAEAAPSAPHEFSIPTARQHDGVQDFSRKAHTG